MMISDPFLLEVESKVNERKVFTRAYILKKSVKLIYRSGRLTPTSKLALMIVFLMRSKAPYLLNLSSLYLYNGFGKRISHI